jgi:hypothetical protein
MATNKGSPLATVRRLSDGRYQATFRRLGVIAADKERACEIAIELGARGGRQVTPPLTTSLLIQAPLS